MRIGIDARTLYAPQLKGIGRYVQHLTRHLASADGGHEYVLFYDGAQTVVDRTPASPRARAVALRAPTREHMLELRDRQLYGLAEESST